jgi:asparagine synthase (glutamine-hydrolysing)
MCGIAGVVYWDGRPPDPDVIDAMCSAMSHRGPDDHQTMIGEGVALGARRLSIIDLETGRQPVSNEDGTITVVQNGEIYNYQELRQDLRRQGHRFRTAGDTETIVHLYEDLGPRLVSELRGMFAFALWDARRRQLLIGRDRLGIKPLYYAELDGGFAFASELKSLLQVPGLRRELNWSAVGHLLSFMVTPGSQSILDGVRKLEPAHWSLISSRGHQTQRYWDVTFEPDTRASEAELVERLRTTLDDAVDLHLRSDVPVGAFLSGGIDSSAVVATMAERAPGRVKTFSIGFREPRYDELPYARRIAEAFGVEHHELVLEPDACGFMEDLVWHLDEPFGDSSAIPTYLVSRLAAEHVKVVLTGDGGDEIFAGYDKYAVERRERRFDLLPGPLRRALGAVGDAMPDGARGRGFLRHLALDGPERYLHASTLFADDEQRRLLQQEAYGLANRADPRAEALRDLAGGNGDWLAALQHCDLRGYLPLDILTKVDRMTMAHSLEARPVLLDHRLVEFAATVPAAFRLRGRTRKYLFKQAMRGRVPQAIIDRPKQGFAVPLAHWFRGAWVDMVRELLLSPRGRQRGLFEPAYVEHLLRLHAGGRNLDLQLWTLVSFEWWCRMFLDGTPEVRPVRTRAAAERRQAAGVADVAFEAPAGGRAPAVSWPT